MRFCTICGKEVTPGKKFCEYCGAPLEQPAVPAVPPASPAVPAAAGPVQAAPITPAGRSGKTKLVAGIVVVLVVIAGIYFIGLPLISGKQGNSPAPRQVTAVPTPSQTLVTAAPSPQPTSVPGLTTIPAASQTYEEKYMETYNQVYSVNHAFIGGQKEVFTQDLITPPLYIKFNITPTIQTGEKVDEFGNMVNTAYVSPNSWFKVNVYDAGNGELKEEQGFNKGFSVTTKQDFMVRAPGSYRVEMSGNDVTAEVYILTGKS